MVHVRRRAVKALQAVVLAHAEPPEETLFRIVLLLSVELVVRLGQPLPRRPTRAAAVEIT